MSKAYVYVVDRDFGFAPNPFHGICTLATCKPRIRKPASIGDWVIGMGGSRLKATGKCIFVMQVTDKLLFDKYWADARFRAKIPVPNGSFKMLVGDNIYHREAQNWVQANSHHSNSDGSPNPLNVAADTATDAVLVSTKFWYFGSSAPVVPRQILEGIGYRNGRNHRVFDAGEVRPLLDFISTLAPENTVVADPFDFAAAAARYSGRGSGIVR